jgi:hypothetical protein
MTRYAHIDLNDSTPKRSKGWYDTELLKYPNLPPENELREMTDEEWDNRHSNNHYHKGQFVKAPPPTNEDIARRIKRGANARYDVSNEMVLRFFEEGLPLPNEWKVYRATLRAIIQGNGALELPKAPDINI